MAKYRKKTAIVEATQWFKVGDHPAIDAYNAINPDGMCPLGFTYAQHGYYLPSGTMVCPGDWIVTNENGNYLVFHPDIFEDTYEPTTQTTEELRYQLAEAECFIGEMLRCCPDCDLLHKGEIR